MNRQRNSLEQGFSLIEVLIAVALLGGAIVLVIGLIPSGFIATVKAGRMTTMSHLAYDKIDELKRLAVTNWDDADIAIGSHPTGAADAMMVSVQMDPSDPPPEYAGYSLEWELTAGPQTRSVTSPGTWESDSEHRTLTVTVAWRKYQQDGTLYNPVPGDQMIRVFKTILASNR